MDGSQEEMQIQVISVRIRGVLRSVPGMILSSSLAVVRREVGGFALIHRATGHHILGAPTLALVVSPAYFMQEWDWDFVDWESEKGKERRQDIGEFLAWLSSGESASAALQRWKEGDDGNEKV